MKRQLQIEGSSGNVFADLRIPNPDEYLAKSHLAVQIFKIVRRRRLTQAAAGKLLGISQPRVSALLNGRLDGFSTDRLFRFLTALGCDVRITISRRAQSPRPNSGESRVSDYPSSKYAATLFSSVTCAAGRRDYPSRIHFARIKCADFDVL